MDLSNNQDILESNRNENKLLLEYLNQIPQDAFDTEIEQLQNLKSVTDTGNKEQVEDYIMTLYGFDEYNDGETYAYIAGATDQGISVLYDLKTNNVLLKHVYGQPEEKYVTDIETLISLLREAKEMFQGN